VLKLSLILVLATLLLAGVGVLWSRQQALDAQAARLQQQAALNAAQQQLDRSRQQQRLIDTHLADYQALAGRGFVGAEDRLAWIEAVQLASREVGLAGLEYRLTPRAASGPELAQGLPLGQTAMFLTMPLLVETDLPRFLAALKTRTPGIYRVHGCRLSRLGSTTFEAVSQPRLQAECELLWFTVAPIQRGTS
jgi:multidrug efflux pump subunit AcrA (membrane-fusion protein)